MEGESFSGMAGNGGGGGSGHQHQQVVDGKLIQTFHKSFVQVQSILDQNRMLISEINQNHESRAPDSLTRNVGLIRELNNNIRRIVGLYADLSASFAPPPRRATPPARSAPPTLPRDAPRPDRSASGPAKQVPAVSWHCDGCLAAASKAEAVC